MSNNRDLLETADERNCTRLSHRRRFAVRRTIAIDQTASQRSSRSTKQTRLPARSSKRDELIKLMDDDDELTDRLFDHLENDYSFSDDFKGTRKSTRNNANNNSNFDDDLRNVLRRLPKLLFYGRMYFAHRDKRTKVRYLHTMLTYAIHYEDFEGTRIILDNIFSGKIYPTIIDHVCSNGRTALWYACRKGDLDLVQQLVEHGHANINKCGVLIVAAQNGHQKIVDYLLNRGCDPNRHTKNYNERAIHAASRRNHLTIVNALLKHGADPTILDYKRRTALDYAIHKRHNDIAKLLICYQDGRFITSKANFTPLMVAVSCNNTSVVNIFEGILSRQQFLDELALLACHYIIYGFTSKSKQAYCYLEKALSMKTPVCNNVPCEAYEFVNECQTLDELALIRENDNAMQMYALLVSERLLLKSGKINYLVSFILRQSDVYKSKGALHRCLQLQLHGYRLWIETEHKNQNNRMWHEKYLNRLVNVLFDIHDAEDTMPVKSLALVWTWILNRADNGLAETLFKLIVITAYVSISLIEQTLINSK